jgi:hypothetical protein
MLAYAPAAYRGVMAGTAPWHILSSTVLRAFSYSEHDHQLRVRFVGGALYRYYDVPPEVAEALLDPPGGSAGRYFNENVRDEYDFEEERTS